MNRRKGLEMEWLIKIKRLRMTEEGRNFLNAAMLAIVLAVLGLELWGMIYTSTTLVWMNVEGTKYVYLGIVVSMFLVGAVSVYVLIVGVAKATSWVDNGRNL